MAVPDPSRWIVATTARRDDEVMTGSGDLRVLWREVSQATDPVDRHEVVVPRPRHFDGPIGDDDREREGRRVEEIEGVVTGSDEGGPTDHVLRTSAVDDVSP